MANMAATVVDPILKFVVFGILFTPGKFIDTSNIHVVLASLSYTQYYHIVVQSVSNQYVQVYFVY